MFMHILDTDPISSVNASIPDLSLVSWGGSDDQNRLFLFCLDPAGVPQFWEGTAALDWSGPFPVGTTPLLGPPVACSWGPGELDVFGVSAIPDDETTGLAHYAFASTGGEPLRMLFGPQFTSFSGITDAAPTDPFIIPGVLAGAGAYTFGQQKVAVFCAPPAGPIFKAAWADGALRPPAPSGGPREAVGVSYVADPAPDPAGSNPFARIHATATHDALARLFIRADGSLITFRQPPAAAHHAGSWTRTDLAGAVHTYHDIAVATNADNVDVFGIEYSRTEAGTLQQWTLPSDGVWSGPERLASLPPAASSPRAVRLDAATLILVFKDAGGILRAFRREEQAGEAPGPFEPAGLPEGRLSYGAVRGATEVIMLDTDGGPRLVVVDVDAATNKLMFATFSNATGWS